MLSYRKSAGLESLARMPPTFAAARKTTWGFVRATHSSVCAWFLRSSDARSAVSTSQFSDLNLLTRAEPTMPPWPATQTFFPVSLNLLVVTTAMLARDRSQVLPHHFRHERNEIGLVSPA